jgi:type II secretory pathway pseudopilin PulG
MAPRNAAFTLLEICLTLAIGMILILIAVPSIVGLLSEQRLHDSYDRFEQFANRARAQSFKEQKTYHLVWDKNSVIMEPVVRLKGEAATSERLPIAKGESYTIERVAALTKNPPAEWTFWPSGTCEPVIISYRGPAGTWRVSFTAFTTRGTLLQSETL